MVLVVAGQRNKQRSIVHVINAERMVALDSDSEHNPGGESSIWYGALESPLIEERESQP